MKYILLFLSLTCACSAQQQTFINGVVVPPGLACVGTNAASQLVLGSSCGGAGAVAWGAISGTLSSQTDLQSALNAKQATGNYIVGLTGDVAASGPGSVSATLATVNGNVGTFGDATHCVTATVNAKGLVTAMSQSTSCPGAGGGGGFYQTFQANGTPVSQQNTFNAVAGTNMTITPTTVGGVTIFTFSSSGGGGGGISVGTLSTLPTTCVVASAPLYYVTDQPSGQQLYNCDSTGHYIQTLNLGGSGALAFASGSLDVTSAVVLRGSAGSFSSTPTFAAGTLSGNFSVAGTPVPTCNSGVKGLQIVAVDVTTNTYGATYVGSGSHVAPLICNESAAWVVY